MTIPSSRLREVCFATTTILQRTTMELLRLDQFLHHRDHLLHSRHQIAQSPPVLQHHFCLRTAAATTPPLQRISIFSMAAATVKQTGAPPRNSNDAFSPPYRSSITDLRANQCRHCTCNHRAHRRSHHAVAAASTRTLHFSAAKGASGNPNLGERRSFHVSSSQWTLKWSKLVNSGQTGQPLVNFVKMLK